MAYCTYTDVLLETGDNIGTATVANVTAMITRSDEEIDDILTENNIPIPSTTPTALKSASICFTIARIKRRQSHELSRPESLNLGGDISFSVKSEQEALDYLKQGNAAVMKYINQQGSRFRFSKVRAV
jgi:hypothetical protein